jgi:hypothetical protein
VLVGVTLVLLDRSTTLGGRQQSGEFVPEEESGSASPDLLLVTRAGILIGQRSRARGGRRAISRRHRRLVAAYPGCRGIDARLSEPIQANNMPFGVGE